MLITLKILNLNAIKDKKVYYKAGGKFTAITNPTFDLTVTKHGIQADYATVNGKKLYLDFYVKSEDGRSMVAAPTCDTYFTVNWVNDVNGHEKALNVEGYRNDDSSLTLYVPLFTSNGVIEQTKFYVPCGSYKCKTNGFEDDRCTPISVNVNLKASKHGFTTAAEAEFYSALEIEGEDRIPSYAEKVILSEDVQKKAAKILEKAFADLKKLGVVVCYDDYSNGFKLIKGKKEDFKQGEKCDADENEIFLPSEAYTYVPAKNTPMLYCSECYGVIMKK